MVDDLMRKPKKPRKKYIGLYVSEELYEKLHRLAERDYTSISTIVRQLIAKEPEGPKVLLEAS